MLDFKSIINARSNQKRIATETCRNLVEFINESMDFTSQLSVLPVVHDLIFQYYSCSDSNVNFKCEPLQPEAKGGTP